MTIMDAVFLASLLCGLVAAFKGSRTAWALLAGAAFTSMLSLRGVEFDPLIWLSIDAAVIGCIASTKLTRRDKIILALFLPAWPSYFVGGLAAYYVASVVVSLQFLLTLPAGLVRWTVKRAKGTLRYRQEWTDLEKRGANA